MSAVENRDKPRCLQCQRKLIVQRAADVTTVESGNWGSRTTVNRGRIIGYGYAGTGLFCSLTCGHTWAVFKIRADRKDGTRTT